MKSTIGKLSRNRRPGGRTAEVTERVNRAALELLVEGGVEACTVQNVASRAGIERSTLYRRYPDRWSMIVEALIAKSGTDIGPQDSGTFAGDLKLVLVRLANVLETPLGPALMASAAGLRLKDGSDYTRGYFDERMAQLETMFCAAITRGELPADVDKEYVFSLAAGPIYFRTFIAGRRVDEDYIDTVVAATCRQFAPPIKRRASPRLVAGPA